MIRNSKFRLGVLWLLVSSLALGVAVNAAEKQIVSGTDRFEFTYELTVPKLKKPAKLWLPIAASDSFQRVELIGVTTAKPWKKSKDNFGNQILTMSLGRADSGKTVRVEYAVTRKEKTPFEPKSNEDVKRHLQSEKLVPMNETLAALAKLATSSAKTDSEKGKALYDHTLTKMNYDKSGKGWGRGDAMDACDSGAGNCTDFHAYFIGLARAQGIPARFSIGFTIPAEKEAGEIGGYHCWAEYFADGKWVPVDISEADKHPELTEYYHGHHPANRFQFTTGRDLVVKPQPASGPINYLIYPLLESDGEELPVERKFSFRRLRK